MGDEQGGGGGGKGANCFGLFVLLDGRLLGGEGWGRLALLLPSSQGFFLPSSSVNCGRGRAENIKRKKGS